MPMHPWLISRMNGGVRLTVRVSGSAPFGLSAQVRAFRDSSFTRLAKAASRAPDEVVFPVKDIRIWRSLFAEGRALRKPASCALPCSKQGGFDDIPR